MYCCKPCERVRTRRKYERSPRKGRYAMLNPKQLAAHKERQRRYAKTPAGRATFLLNAYRKVDRMRGRLCTITRAFLITHIFPHPCFYCGDTLEWRGCDRLDNAFGHTPNNVVPCCAACNIARSDYFSVEEMVELGRAIREIKRQRRNTIDSAAP